MGEKFVQNDFFKDIRQKWKIRDGAVVFQKIFVKWSLFQQGFYNCSLQTTWYNASCKRCVDDVGDGRQEDVKSVRQKCGGDGIEFTRFRRSFKTGELRVDWVLSKTMLAVNSTKMEVPLQREDKNNDRQKMTWALSKLAHKLKRQKKLKI